MARPSPVAVLILAATHVSAAGLHPETGLYSFQTFGADQYGASPQNWAIAQDHRGVMYFGNTDGVLEFDGAMWRLLATHGVVRALAVDAKGTVYVGSSGDFGYLKADARGVEQFTSLAGKLPPHEPKFLDVWRVFAERDGIYFSSYNWLARLNADGSLKVWHPEERFGKAFRARGTIYVRTSDEKLLALAGDKLTRVPGAGSDSSIVGAVASGDEAIVASSHRLYRLGADGLRAFDSEAGRYLAAKTIYSIARLPGGDIAVGTTTDGIVLMDDAGNIRRAITDAEGLPANYISDIASDRQGNVWLTTFNGIARFNPGLSTYDKTLGLSGNVLCTTRAGDGLYVGTTTGLFHLATAPGAPPRFDRIDGIHERVFVVLAQGNELLAGTSHGVFAVDGIHATAIPETPGVIYDLNASPSHPGDVYAAGREGLFILRKDPTGWVRLSALAEAGQEFRSIAEDADGRVWATTTRDLIWRIDFTSEPAKAQSFRGVKTGWQNAYRFRGHVVFGTETGLMSFSEGMQRLVPERTLGAMFADGSHDVYSLTEDAKGDVWISGREYHGILRRSLSGTQWQPMPLLESRIQGLFSLHPDADGTVWASGKDYRLFRWSPTLAGDPNRDFHILTRRIALLDSQESLYGGVGAPPAMHVPYRDNALNFQFAAPFYEGGGAVEYQYHLEGGNRSWSRWSREPQASFPRLTEGRYVLRVHARNPHGRVTEESLSAFSIAPPWFRTWWAYLLYAALAATLIWGGVKLRRMRQLQEDNQRLEKMVEERTVEIRQQRDEIHAQERKSHSLLLNIMPAQVADELKNTGAVQPVGFDDVTVCFTDFVGFTLSSEKMPPSRLVDALNEYFTAFDEIIARYGLEKLKTIGDSYMFVSGLPNRRASHAVDAVLAALEMVDVVKKLGSRADSTGWNIRVGLHSGPVVAGVVGIRKFAFDIWGNTVNFAARMESSGVPGTVNMSERTCRLTCGLIECESRGNVRIKEGRELLMFLARGVGADFAARYEQEFGAKPTFTPALAATENLKLLRSAVS